MARKIKHGKRFEEDIANSCKNQSIWFFNIKDTYMPLKYRNVIRVPKNEYDCLIYYDGYLFPMELKSTQGKSISFSESIIKQHQIENLLKANEYEGVIAGFLMNFRNANNRTFWIPIDEFVAYKHVAENGIENHTYKSRVNKSSIPIGICEEIGIELKNELKRVRYNYLVKDLLKKIIEKEGVRK